MVLDRTGTTAESHQGDLKTLQEFTPCFSPKAPEERFPSLHGLVMEDRLSEFEQGLLEGIGGALFVCTSQETCGAVQSDTRWCCVPFGTVLIRLMDQTISRNSDVDVSTLFDDTRSNAMSLTVLQVDVERNHND